MTMQIEPRFCGPPDAGNGGYVCGRLASFIEGPAVVRLQLPPPLEVKLEVRSTGTGVELLRGADIVAWARPSQVALEIPAAPSYAEAEAASHAYAGFRAHPFPDCFVCGPQRKEGDGLRIFAGPLPGRNLVAAPWVPHPSLGDPKGNVRPEFIWAALDCPGAFSFDAPPGTPLLLGELAAAIKGPVAVGERCVAVGWALTRDGRRHYTATALFSESGECRGLARATWFVVPEPGSATND